MIQKMAYKNVVSKANEYMSDICRYSSGVVHLSCQNKIELPSPVIEISPLKVMKNKMEPLHQKEASVWPRYWRHAVY